MWGQRSVTPTPTAINAWGPAGSRIALGVKGQGSVGAKVIDLKPDNLGSMGLGGVRDQRSVTPTPTALTAWEAAGSRTALGVRGQGSEVNWGKGQGPQPLLPQTCGAGEVRGQRSVTPTPIEITLRGPAGSRTDLRVKGQGAEVKGQRPHPPITPNLWGREGSEVNDPKPYG